MNLGAWSRGRFLFVAGAVGVLFVWFVAKEDAYNATMLYKTQPSTLIQHISAPLSTTLEVLRRPEELTSSSGLFASIVPHPPDSTDTFKVTENMPVNILGRPLFSIASSFDVRYVMHEDGIEAFVSAGAGTRLRCRWVARAVEGENSEEKTVVEESIEVTAIMPAFGYVRRTALKNHRITLENVKNKVEGLTSS